MFSVHGVSGRVFSGTLEEMSRVRELTRSRSQRTVTDEEGHWQLDNLPGTAALINDKAVRA